jgi:heme-degrading monooxygenase HmoA
MGNNFVNKALPTDRPMGFPAGNIMMFLIRDTFKLPTIMLFGALLQILVCAVLPMRWAIVPASCLLLNAVVTTIIQLMAPEPNAFKSGVVDGRVTAQLPSEKGTFSSEPSVGEVVVFQLGIQYNHPLGVFGPGRMEVSQSFTKMNDDLMKRRDEFGLLGMSRWRGNERETHNTMLLTYYFKDVQSINRFAHEELHRRGWDQYHASEWKNHIGIFHETYVAPAKHFESIYANCRPVLLGRGLAKCETEAGPKWVNTLVDADNPVLKTHYTRLGRDAKGNIM